MPYLSQCDVAAIGERCDDEPLLAAQVLVLIVEVHVRDARLRLLDVLLEVEAGLLQPLEVQHGADVEPHEHVEDVALVHVHRNQGLVLGPLHLVQVLGRLSDERVQDVEEFVVRLGHNLKRIEQNLFVFVKNI